MGLISLLFSDPILFVAIAAMLVFSIIAHEVSHGAMAYLFGDSTAKRYGRLTLNPISHFDPIGALMLFTVGFGWARPVPVDYGRLRRNPFALLCVSLAGCMMNILLAIAAIFCLRFQAIAQHPVYSQALPIIIQINIILSAFNLIPIPPLDGSKVLMSFLSSKNQIRFARLEPYGFIILILLLLTGFLKPVIFFMEPEIYQLINFIF